MNDQKEIQANDQPQLMITVSDDMEADRIAAALEDEGIPVAREYSREMRASSVLMGNAVGEIRLLVPSSEEERAREILIGIGALESGEEAEPAEEVPPQGKKVSSFWLMVLVLLLTALAVFGTDAIVGLFQKVFAK
ncbi:MAG: DUF2007 domain-containing protein [Firmicutes bacterium]|nr:DUF2007 domain-containing protein [Bacillota bacterium]